MSASRTVRALPLNGGPAKDLTPGPEETSEARFAPDGKTIVFVRTTEASGRENADLYSIRPSGTGITRLTTTGRVDEFDPRYFAGGIVFSRGNQSEGPAGYADIYTMRKNGTKVKPLVEGVGSAYVEDVSPQGHTLIFRRDRGLWVKQIGPKRAKKVVELPDGSQANSVFSSDGTSVATSTLRITPCPKGTGRIAPKRSYAEARSARDCTSALPMISSVLP